MSMIAPVLEFTPGPKYAREGVVRVACPICGDQHIHGALDGWRTPHCRQQWPVSVGEYEIVGTEEARKRASRREAALPTPYWSNRDLARVFRTRAIWSRVPLGLAAELIGDFVATSGEPQRVRSMSLAQFDAWLTRGHLDEIALRAGFVVPWWGRGNRLSDFLHASDNLRIYGFCPDRDPVKLAARDQIASTARGGR